MDPATMALISTGIGAAGSLLGGGGGDKFMSLKDRWGKHMVGNIKDLQQGILDQGPLEYYPGQTFANLNPFQQQAYLGMAGYGADWNTGGMVEDAQLGAGMSGADAITGGADYLSQIMSGGSPQMAPGGLFDQIYNNPNLPGMVDAATRDITRDLNWNTLPGIDQAAAASGNMASSRTGIAEGMARGMAQDRISDVTADIYNNAFNQAVEGALGQDRTALSGAQGLGTLGLSGLGSAYGSGADNLKLQLGGGQGFQDQIQRVIDEDMARYNFNQQAPMNNYQQQLALLTQTLPGGGQLPNTANTFDRLTQGAQMGMGLYDAFRGIGGGSTQPDIWNIPSNDWLTGGF